MIEVHSIGEFKKLMKEREQDAIKPPKNIIYEGKQPTLDETAIVVHGDLDEYLRASGCIPLEAVLRNLSNKMQ